MRKYVHTWERWIKIKIDFKAHHLMWLALLIACLFICQLRNIEDLPTIASFKAVRVLFNSVFVYLICCTDMIWKKIKIYDEQNKLL